MSRRRVVILWAGRHQREPWESLCAGYRERIARHLDVRDQRIGDRVVISR